MGVDGGVSGCSSNGADLKRLQQSVWAEEDGTYGGSQARVSSPRVGYQSVDQRVFPYTEERWISADMLDFDDIGTQVTQQHATVGCSQHSAQIDDFDAFKRWREGTSSRRLREAALA